MSGIAKFVKTIVLLGLFLGATGTLLEVSGILGRRAAEAHRNGGIKLKELNRMLQN